MTVGVFLDLTPRDDFHIGEPSATHCDSHQVCKSCHDDSNDKK
jgi:hypothetical protein